MTYALQDFLKPLIATVSRRTAVFIAVLVGTIACLSLFSAASARADDTSELCSGYAGCSINGFTTNGYQYAEDKMWWEMYPGINCTNYAAYVESQVFGVPKPHYLLGDGGDWGVNAAAHGVPVNNVPAVGTVAVWDAYSSGMGADGHVGIVEAIGPNDSYIDVSQSGMGTSDDGFEWERVYANDSSWESWPDSFIHFSGTKMPTSMTATSLLGQAKLPSVKLRMAVREVS